MTSKMQVCDLSGRLLNLFVARITNPDWFVEDDVKSIADDELRRFLTMDSYEEYDPSSNWDIGGRILEKEEITLAVGGGEWTASMWSKRNEAHISESGPTPLVAAMRVYVAAFFGDEVDVNSPPKSMLSEGELNVINGLRRRGFAVTLYAPEEIRGLDRSLIEGVMVHEAAEVITLLGEDDPDDINEIEVAECLKLTKEMTSAKVKAKAQPESAPAAARSDDPEAKAPVFNRCAASVEEGILHMEDGTPVDLLKIIAACNSAFQQLGDQEYMEAADEASKIAGVMQGPHGQWITAS